MSTQKQWDAHETLQSVPFFYNWVLVQFLASLIWVPYDTEAEAVHLSPLCGKVVHRRPPHAPCHRTAMGRQVQGRQ